MRIYLDVEIRRVACLELEWRPGRNAKVTQAEGFIDEVEVKVQALAGIVLKKGFSGFLVVPRFITGAGFHGWKNMNETRLFTPPLEDVLDALFFAVRVGLADELDLDTIVPGDTLSVFADFFPKLLSKSGVVEYFDLPGIQKGRHALIKAPAGQCALQNYTIITGQNSGNLFSIAFGYHRDSFHAYKVYFFIIA
jgi:hypothetical protein